MKTHCPICKKKIDSYFKRECEEPFTHYNPMIGLTIYGPYSADKEVICNEDGYLHFMFGDGDHRLVELGVSEVIINPAEYHHPAEHSFSDCHDDEDDEGLPF